jgi:hypothetical protein
VGKSAETKLKLMMVVVVVERKREIQLQQLIMSDKKPLSPISAQNVKK